jgi:hypothetical protein
MSRLGQKSANKGPFPLFIRFPERSGQPDRHGRIVRESGREIWVGNDPPVDFVVLTRRR